jgi:uncharacterized membrane protein YbhN (UPF0104 family)
VMPLVALGAFVAAVAYLAATFQWEEAFALLATADIAILVGGSGTALMAYWAIRALRWRLLMQGMGVRCGFLSLYLCSSAALGLSVLTPLQSGEVLKVELLRKTAGAGRLPGYSAVMLERVADLYAVVALGIIAAVATALSPLGGAFAAAALLVVPWVAYRLVPSISLTGRLGQFVAHMRSGLRSPHILVVFMAWTFAGWLLVAAAWQACLRSISIDLGMMELLGLLSSVTLATILSFVPAGLGVAEAGTSGILIHYGMAAPLAQAGALALRAFSVMVVALGGLHLLLLRWHWRHMARRLQE